MDQEDEDKQKVNKYLSTLRKLYVFGCHHCHSLLVSSKARMHHVCQEEEGADRIKRQFASVATLLACKSCGYSMNITATDSGEAQKRHFVLLRSLSEFHNCSKLLILNIMCSYGSRLDETWQIQFCAVISPKMRDPCCGTKFGSVRDYRRHMYDHLTEEGKMAAFLKMADKNAQYNDNPQQLLTSSNKLRNQESRDSLYPPVNDPRFLLVDVLLRNTELNLSDFMVPFELSLRPTKPFSGNISERVRTCTYCHCVSVGDDVTPEHSEECRETFPFENLRLHTLVYNKSLPHSPIGCVLCEEKACSLSGYKTHMILDHCRVPTWSYASGVLPLLEDVEASTSDVSPAAIDSNCSPNHMADDSSSDTLLMDVGDSSVTLTKESDAHFTSNLTISENLQDHRGLSPFSPEAHQAVPDVPLQSSDAMDVATDTPLSPPVDSQAALGSPIPSNVSFTPEDSSNFPEARSVDSHAPWSPEPSPCGLVDRREVSPTTLDASSRSSSSPSPSSSSSLSRSADPATLGLVNSGEVSRTPSDASPSPSSSLSSRSQDRAPSGLEDGREVSPIHSDASSSSRSPHPAPSGLEDAREVSPAPSDASSSSRSPAPPPPSPEDGEVSSTDSDALSSSSSSSRSPNPAPSGLEDGREVSPAHLDASPAASGRSRSSSDEIPYSVDLQYWLNYRDPLLAILGSPKSDLFRNDLDNSPTAPGSPSSWTMDSLDRRLAVWSAAPLSSAPRSLFSWETSSEEPHSSPVGSVTTPAASSSPFASWGALDAPKPSKSSDELMMDSEDLQSASGNPDSVEESSAAISSSDSDAAPAASSTSNTSSVESGATVESKAPPEASITPSPSTVYPTTSWDTPSTSPAPSTAVGSTIAPVVPEATTSRSPLLSGGPPVGPATASTCSSEPTASDKRMYTSSALPTASNDSRFSSSSSLASASNDSRSSTSSTLPKASNDYRSSTSSSSSGAPATSSIPSRSTVAPPPPPDPEVSMCISDVLAAVHDVTFPSDVTMADPVVHRHPSESEDTFLETPDDAMDISPDWSSNAASTWFHGPSATTWTSWGPPPSHSQGPGYGNSSNLPDDVTALLDDVNFCTEAEKCRVLVVGNLRETLSNNSTKRAEGDFNRISLLLRRLGIIVPPVATHRVGRFSPRKSRLVKVLLPHASLCAIVLKNFPNLPQSDQFKNAWIQPLLSAEQRMNIPHHVPGGHSMPPPPFWGNFPAPDPMFPPPFPVYNAPRIFFPPPPNPRSFYPPPHQF